MQLLCNGKTHCIATAYLFSLYIEKTILIYKKLLVRSLFLKEFVEYIRQGLAVVDSFSD